MDVSGTYVAVSYIKSTRDKLGQWMAENCILNPISIEDIHTTVLYSRVELDERYHVSVHDDIFGIFNWWFTPLEFDLFDSDGKKALVLRLNAPELEALHLVLRSAGGTHDHPEYCPHVTLSYDYDGDISKLDVPQIAFIPQRLYNESLKIDWS